MNRNTFLTILVIAIIAVVAILTFNKNDNQTNNTESRSVNTETRTIVEKQEPEVKEFTMTSYVEMVDGKPKPQFSLKEITVNKGDKVRIKITVTSGMHDFRIDEYDIYADTQLNQEKVVEFTADKAGEFIYYCTKPGHRQNGQWGTLKVI